MYDFCVYKDAHNVLRVKGPDTQEYPVKILPYFPLTQKSKAVGLFLLNDDGYPDKEVHTVFDLALLDASSRQIIELELKVTNTPTLIKRIFSVQRSDEKFTFVIETAVGERKNLCIPEHNNIKMLNFDLMLLKDTNENKFIVDISRLDARSRALVDMFI